MNSADRKEKKKRQQEHARSKKIYLKSINLVRKKYANLNTHHTHTHTYTHCE